MMRLIRDYLAAVSRAEALLRARWGDADLLSMAKRGEIPKEGMLDAVTRYAFHGVGCLVESRELELDFDFGPDGRTDGFDLWRLKKYWASRREHYPEIDSQEALARAFEALEAQGEIARWDDAPSPHLYRLTAPRGVPPRLSP